jgi:hypothetical protein
VVVAGLQDAVVETMVELGMTMPHIHAVLDLDDALALSRESEQEDGFADWDTSDADSSPTDLTEV